jgi:hypothetical protein
MNTTIYTLGYIGRKLESVEVLLARFGAILVDVRMVPRSRTQVWNSGVLRRHFGEQRYVWLKEFGNPTAQPAAISTVDAHGGRVFVNTTPVSLKFATTMLASPTRTPPFAMARSSPHNKYKTTLSFFSRKA